MSNFVNQMGLILIVAEPKDMRFLIKGEEAALFFSNLSEPCGCCIGNYEMDVETCEKLQKYGVKSVYMHYARLLYPDQYAFSQTGYAPGWYDDFVRKYRDEQRGS